MKNEKLWWDLLQPLVSKRQSFTTKEAAECWNVATSTARTRLHSIRYAKIAFVCKCNIMIDSKWVPAWHASPLPAGEGE